VKRTIWRLERRIHCSSVATRLDADEGRVASQSLATLHRAANRSSVLSVRVLMRRSPRKTATKVRNGKVARKNRTDLTSHYAQTRQSQPFIDRQRPGAGYRHFLTIKDVKTFIQLLPDWAELSRGLDAIVLAEGNTSCMGWYGDGIVAVCGWERELTQDWDKSFVTEHQYILDQLGVEREPMEDDPTGQWCYFDEQSIKGFQLMHILLHELSHHHDRMTTRSQDSAARGEPFAEQYANQYADTIWDRYLTMFGW
jgi:hypothetical protein